MNRSTLPDETLCALAQQQDNAAEDALVLRFTQLVRICARPLFLFGGDSEDLTQEGMLGLLSAIRSYSPDRGSSFRTYAELCIRRRMLTAIRQAAGRRHSALNDSLPLDSLLEEGGIAPSPETEGNPETLLILRETVDERLSSLRSRLSPLEGQVFELFLDGLSRPEIVQRLRRSSKSVDNAIQRIRHKLDEEQE